MFSFPPGSSKQVPYEDQEYSCGRVVVGASSDGPLRSGTTLVLLLAFVFVIIL